MYFIGDDKDEIDARYGIHTSLRRSIISQLQELLHERNNLVQLFKIAIDMMPSDTHKIVIHADKTSVGEHVRRYNAPTINEVAIVMVGGGRGSRVVWVSDRGLLCHGFEPSTTKDPPCRAAMHVKSVES
ncbi:uncharacterized protein TNCV_969621 [Trichonephila clavipes]|nr:uncharacterized protein TNCV_969621 [Trichonephila clavipes]